MRNEYKPRLSSTSSSRIIKYYTSSTTASVSLLMPAALQCGDPSSWFLSPLRGTRCHTLGFGEHCTLHRVSLQTSELVAGLLLCWFVAHVRGRLYWQLAPWVCARWDEIKVANKHYFRLSWWIKKRGSTHIGTTSSSFTRRIRSRKYET